MASLERTARSLLGGEQARNPGAGADVQMWDMDDPDYGDARRSHERLRDKRSLRSRGCTWRKGSLSEVESLFGFLLIAQPGQMRSDQVLKDHGGHPLVDRTPRTGQSLNLGVQGGLSGEVRVKAAKGGWKGRGCCHGFAVLPDEFGHVAQQV